MTYFIRLGHMASACLPMRTKFLVFVMAFVFIPVDGCAVTKPSVAGVVVSNLHVGSIVDGKILAVSGDRIEYAENHACAGDSGSVPCMLIGFGFDVVHFEPGETLICALQLKADPSDIPQFAAYQDGIVRREFVLDLQKISSPVIMKTMIQRDASDHGQLSVSWTCKNRDSVVVAGGISVDLGH